MNRLIFKSRKNTGISTSVIDIKGTIDISGNILPSTTLTYDLGSSTQRWRDIYLSGNTIDLGGTKITKDVSSGGIKLLDASGTTLGATFQDVSINNLNITGNIYQNGTLFTGGGGGGSSQWTTNGSNIYYNTGNIGIGTTIASQTLDISGGITMSGNIMSVSGKMNNVNISVLNKRVKASYANVLKASGKWISRPSATETVRWKSVCWAAELGIFVAVGEDTTNLVMTSSDGINWIQRVSASETNVWWSVCWSAELSIFVAVAYNGYYDGRVMTSPNGITWTSRNSGNNTYQWSSVCWSPELSLFVAVAVSGAQRVMTSSDGITWTLRSASNNNNTWNSVCWSPELGLFVAVADTGYSKVMTSSNGIDWVGRLSADENYGYWKSICWSPELGIFVSVATSGQQRIMSSSDGINWVGRSNVYTGNSICWSPELSMFVICLQSSVTTSRDGINWSVKSCPNNNWYGICWSPELSIFVVVGGIGTQTNRVMTSAIALPNSLNTLLAPSSQISIDTSGNIGIGTSTPLQGLDVSNNVFFRSNVGIGSLIPSQKLDVSGNMYVSGDVFVKGNKVSSQFIGFNVTCSHAAYQFTYDSTVTGVANQGYDIIILNIGNCWDANTGYFTPTIAGYYYFSASAYLGVSSGTRSGFAIYKNTTQVVGSGANIGAVYSIYPSISTVLYMNGTTDYVKVVAGRPFVSTSNNGVYISDGNNFCGHLLYAG